MITFLHMIVVMNILSYFEMGIQHRLDMDILSKPMMLLAGGISMLGCHDFAPT